MENLTDGPSQASDTLFARALKQQWPAMEAAIVAGLVRPVAGQEVDGRPPHRELVAAIKCLLAADRLGLDVNGTEHEHHPSIVTLAPIREELLHDPEYLEFLRNRVAEEDGHARPVHANGDGRQVEDGSAPGSA